MHKTHKKRPLLFSRSRFSGDPCGNRTHVNGVRGRCLNRLTNGPYKKRSRHLPIFTGRLQPTIFGTSELNYCVRNGNRWDLTVIDTGHHMALRHASLLSSYHTCGRMSRDTPSKLNIELLANRVSSKMGSSPRPISTALLNASRHLHILPINLVVFKGSYLIIQWDILS